MATVIQSIADAIRDFESEYNRAPREIAIYPRTYERLVQESRAIGTGGVVIDGFSIPSIMGVHIALIDGVGCGFAVLDNVNVGD